MKKFTYTKTALASLLTLCSFNSFAIDGEIKKLGHNNTSVEVTNTSNKRLREKMDRICDTSPKKKEEKSLIHKAKDTAHTIGNKTSETTRDIGKKVSDAAKTTKNKAHGIKQSAQNKLSDANNTAKSKADRDTSLQKKDVVDIKNNVKTNDIKPVINKNVNSHTKSVSDKTEKGIKKDTGVKVTFGAVFDAQSYYKAGSMDDNYKSFNVMSNKNGIDITGNYSEDIGTVADAVLHLRAESNNEELSLTYGADVQLQAPIAKGKGEIYGLHAIQAKGAHLFLNTEYGNLKVGYQFGPEALMRLDATKIATIDGAADSDWFKKVNIEGKEGDFPFYVTPRLYTESLSSGSAKFAFKEISKQNLFTNTLPFRVAYYSPSYMGCLRFGISYSPRYEEGLFESSKSKKEVGFSYDENKIRHFLVDNLLKIPDDKTVGNIDSFIGSGSGKVDIATLPAEGGTVSSIGREKVEQLVDILSDSMVNIVIENITVRNALDAISTKIDQGISGDIRRSLSPAVQADMKTQIMQSIEEGKFTDLADFKTKLASTTEKVVAEALKSSFNSSIDHVINILKKSNVNGIVHHVGPSYEHIVSAGLLYEYNFEEYKLKVQAAAVGEYGKARKPDAEKHIYNQFTRYHDLQGVNLGVKADYKIDEDQSIKFIASFAHLGKSGQPKEDLILQDNKYKEVPGDKDIYKPYNNDTMYWTVGAGYQYENVYASVNYFGSKMNDGDKLHDFALGVQYNLSPAESKAQFIPYAALHYFTTKEDSNNKSTSSRDAIKDNKGSLMVVGVKFIF